ncbi:MAG: hypothetical protein EXQ49_04980 [Acidobacteria bacterium]|nr:hypothetical protein [Acidobacteriota bacterium]
MSRKTLSCAFVVLSLLVGATLVPTLHADVKKREKTALKFEGMLGRVMGMAGGSAMKDGLTSTVAVKGNRKATLNDQTGQIVDLSEEKIYDIGFTKKECRVMTFDQLRAQIKKAQADAAKAAKDMPAENRDELDQPGKEVEVSFDVKATGETRTIAGHPAKQVIVTITAHEKGKTLEEGGGMVMTNEIWVGPRIAALNEVELFDSKFVKAVYGDSAGAMAQQFAGMAAMYSSLQKVMAQTEAQMKKLDGMPLLIVQKTETAKSAAAMAEAPAAPASGGGLSGALARRMMGNKKPEQRNLLYASTSETLSIDPAASDLDVALPAGLKEKK